MIAGYDKILLTKILMTTIKLGQRVKDKVSGFIGIAVAECEYLNGCIQFHVSPPVDENGNERKDQWIDAAQLEIVDNGVLPEPKKEPDYQTYHHQLLL